MEKRLDKITNRINTLLTERNGTERNGTERVYIRQATSKGYIECCVPGFADFSYPTSKLRRGRVQGGGKISPTITTTGGVCKIMNITNVKPCAFRGRKMLHAKRTEYGKQIRKDYESHKVTEKRSNIQRLEPRKDGLGNTITTVSKDCMYIGRLEHMEEHEIDKYLHNDYGVFKLTSRECGRLMGVSDEDIDKMKAVNSNTQLLKQFGNSIVVPVLMAIFSQLNIKGVTPWNERKDLDFS